jgi:type II secretory pathway component PulC
MDVIKDVNGVPLKSPAEAIGLLTGLQNENSLSLNVQRGGGRITLNYKIE